MNLTKFELDKETFLKTTKKDILDYLKQKNNLSFYKIKNIEKYLGEVFNKAIFNNNLMFFIEEENSIINFYDRLTINSLRAGIDAENHRIEDKILIFSNNDNKKIYNQYNLPFSKDKLIIASNKFENRNDLVSYIDVLIPNEFTNLLSIYNNSHLIKQYEIFVNKIKPALEIVYNNDFDIQIKKQNLCILLKEPGFIIENRHGDRTTISNLIVELIFTLKDDKIVLSNFGAFKHRFDDGIDICSGYVHSHRRANSIEYLFRSARFCTGGTDFTIFLKSIEEREITQEEFDLLLYQIKEYLVWESEEGTPYVYFTSKNNLLSKYNYVELEEISSSSLSLLSPKIETLLNTDSDFYESFIKIDFEDPNYETNESSFSFLHQLFHKILLKEDISYCVSFAKIENNKIKYSRTNNYNILKEIAKAECSFESIPYEYFRDSKIEYSINFSNLYFELIKNEENYEPIASKKFLSIFKQRFMEWKTNYTTECLSRNISIEEHIREDFFFV